MQRERGRETQVGVMNGKTGAGKKITGKMEEPMKAM